MSPEMERYPQAPVAGLTWEKKQRRGQRPVAVKAPALGARKQWAYWEPKAEKE